MLSPPATLADGGATLARLKAGVQAERAALQTRFRETADGPMVLREHRRLVDRVLKDMWRQLRRSEEHTSELQSLAYLVCRLLLEKKKEPSVTVVATPEPQTVPSRHHATV